MPHAHLQSYLRAFGGMAVKSSNSFACVVKQGTIDHEDYQRTLRVHVEHGTYMCESNGSTHLSRHFADAHIIGGGINMICAP